MTTSQDFSDQAQDDAVELSEWQRFGVDTSAPHSARVYDYWLGGKTNFPPDRAMGQAIEQAVPSVKAMAKENRAFQGRAVRYLAREQGIRQFLDLGTGIPTSPNTHEIAEAVSPGTRVVYVDNDPIVLAHARALMVSTPASRTTYIHADLGKPAELLGDPALTSTLDLDRPVGLLMIAVLMLVADEDDPWAKVAALRDALPSV
ncbi:SAM-dependent methyltransferase, partial [Kitasatospora sp. NPDC058263]